MAFQRFTSSTGRANIARGRRFDGSKWVEGERLRRFDGSKWVTIWEAYTPMSLAIDPPIPMAMVPTGGIARVTVYARPTGGTGNYTYSWEWVSGGRTHVGHTAGPDCTFESRSSTSSQYKLTVSDGVSSTSLTFTVQLSVGSLGGPL